MTPLDTALAEAAAVCARITDRDELMVERRQVWARAKDAGATYDQIAELCGVSAALVRLEVSKEKGKAWATGA